MKATHLATLGIVLCTGCGAVTPQPTPVGQSPEERVTQSARKLVSAYAQETAAYLKSNSAASAIEDAKRTVRDKLKDPDSAQFRKVRLVDHDGGKIVCGQVNGKNSFGGYVGYKSFASSPTRATIQSADTTYSLVNDALTTAIYVACGT